MLCPGREASIQSLQASPDRVRNVCVLAHVDHGKTSLSDSLVASNGIISGRQAGKVRFLDSRTDEQERGITMKASSIALLHKYHGDVPFLVNLVDSPGHVDFSSEVSAAVRLCDGAIVVVDVVEGVCIQTHAVLRQAWMERVCPCLVLNKVDRLITQLRMTPSEAYSHLRKVLERVNAVMGELYREQELLQQQEGHADGIDGILGPVDEVIFSPERGNVVFASALDRWAFRVDQFAGMYARKMGCDQEVLEKTLWGDYFWNAKTKRIVSSPQGNSKPLFVQLILERLWDVYNAAFLQTDHERVRKIVQALQLELPPRELNSRDAKLLLQSVCSRWLPIPEAVLAMVVEKLPSPVAAQKIRIPILCPALHSPELQAACGEELTHIRENITMCAASNAEVAVFVSKMLLFEPDALPRSKTHPAVTIDTMTPEDKERRHREVVAARAAAAAAACVDREDTLEQQQQQQHQQQQHQQHQQHQHQQQQDESLVSVEGAISVAMVRVFSGTLRRGQRLRLFDPIYSPLHPHEHFVDVEVTDLYLLMGKHLEILDEVPAGNICGVGGLGNHVMKTATLSSSLACPSFVRLNIQAPVVRVAVEPVAYGDMPRLATGLRLLHHSDPNVRVLVQETGEHVVIVSGEVHLDRCLRDLRDFARIDVHVSPPIVAFRETVVAPESLSKAKVVIVHTASKMCAIHMKACALPRCIINVIEAHQKEIREAMREELMLSELADFARRLQGAFQKAGNEWEGEFDSLWALGPRKCGSSILVNHIQEYRKSGLFRPLFAPNNTTVEGLAAPPAPSTLMNQILHDLDNSIATGFQSASLAGPLCDEPLEGVCIAVEGVVLLQEDPRGEGEATIQYGPLSGQVIAAMKKACHQALLAGSLRLVEPIYACEIHTTVDALGKVYGLLMKRRGSILREDVKEGTSIHFIEAYLPVVESFGFADELRKMTSGAAGAQLLFSHWSVLDMDPLFVPTTDEEIELCGRTNIAREFMHDLRRRKGLFVEEQIVAFGEKQRTLAKKV